MLNRRLDAIIYIKLKTVLTTKVNTTPLSSNEEEQQLKTSLL